MMNKRSRTAPTPSKESVALVSSSLEMRGLKKELGSINGSTNKYYDQFNGIPHALVGAAMIRLFVIDVMGILITILFNIKIHHYHHHNHYHRRQQDKVPLMLIFLSIVSPPL